MRAVLLLLTLLALAILLPPAARGEEARAVGNALAGRLCATCHAVDGVSVAVVAVGLPSMRAIANMPGQNRQRIFDVLIRPHIPMPDMQLTTAEIASLLAFLESLREPGKGPSLEMPDPPSRRPPPKRPS
jgi:mono/diheme cytochrome c family protein